MQSDKWVMNFFFIVLMAAGLLAFAILLTADAHADWRDREPATTANADTSQQQDQQQGQTASASGSGQASNEGNNSTTNNSNRVFYFNSSLPSAGKCFGAIEAGGGGSGGGGFLGWRPLNNDCWFAALADAEKNAQVRARLKCASKMFRNAIAYDRPKPDRQGRCIDYMVNTYIEQIAFERSQVQEMLDAQTLVISDHVTTETERTSASTTRAVERCTDCFGERAK